VERLWRGRVHQQMPPEDELKQAEERVIESEERIARQQELIAKLERDGQDASAARETLTVLQTGHELLVALRNMLRRP
jgi:hypothetical protein